MAITIHVDKLVGGVITINTGERNPAMTRLWWTTPRSGEMQSRDGGDYSDVAITGELTQSSINNIDGHSRTSVVAVEIGNTVTSIGNDAFSNCSWLTSVTIPDGVTSIGYSAFSECGGLTSVTIPSSVTSIESYAFQNCSGLTGVAIGNGVQSIGFWAFYGCRYLTNLTIPSSVTYIGSGAFGYCQSLVSLDLSNIDVYASLLIDAFYGSSIQELWINDSSVNVLSNAPGWGLGIDPNGRKFMMVVYCNDGTVVINGNEGSSSGNSSGNSGKTIVRYANGQVRKLDVNGTLGNSDFWPDYHEITSVDIGTNVNSIDAYCFDNMDNLSTVYVPSSVDPLCISMGAFQRTYMSELYMYHVPTSTVLTEASYWGIGFDVYYYPYPVVVYCSDGIVVINGGSAISDGSGSGSY